MRMLLTTTTTRMNCRKSELLTCLFLSRYLETTKKQRAVTFMNRREAAQFTDLFIRVVLYLPLGRTLTTTRNPMMTTTMATTMMMTMTMATKGHCTSAFPSPPCRSTTDWCVYLFFFCVLNFLSDSITLIINTLHR